MDMENKERTSVVRGNLPVAYQLELHRLIEVNAYLRAEADGFKRSPLEYWLVAEEEMLL